MNQGQVSLLTDDNSVNDSEQSLVLNYSEERDELVSEEKQEEKPEQQGMHSLEIKPDVNFDACTTV